MSHLALHMSAMRTRTAVGRTTAAALGVLLPLSLAAEPNPADLKASFAQEKAVARSAGAIPVELKVQNTGSDEAALKPPLAAIESVSIATAEGKALAPASPKPAEGAVALGTMLPERLQAGQDTSIELDLRARFPDLSKPGAYRVTWKHPSFGGAATLELRVVEGYATIKTNFGSIVIEFHPEDAPNTVDNFITLAKKKFYDGLTFHRIIPGFMMQGGCPKGDGSGGPGYQIKAEFNARKHLAGTVSMARRQDPDSAGSQFFICFAPRESLDGQYTAFAEVVRGMDVAKKVEAVGSPGRGTPRQKVQIESVTVSDSLPKDEANK